MELELGALISAMIASGETPTVPKKLLRERRAQLVGQLENIPQDEHAVKSKKEQIKFCTYLHNGDRVKAQRAIDRITKINNEVLDLIMFSEDYDTKSVTILGDIQHHSDKDDENAVVLGGVMKKELDILNLTMKCRFI